MKNLTFDADISQSKVDMNAELDAHTLMKSRTSSKLLIRTLSENTQIQRQIQIYRFPYTWNYKYTLLIAKTIKF